MIARRTLKLNDNQAVRSYELSIWTLHDDFISVLKSSNLDVYGSIQNPIMSLVSDGTQELSFSIPMYITVRGEKQENPLWRSIYSERVVANTRKIKVIFNKGYPEKGIFEFVITAITENHNKNGVFCDVTATGLPFYELGKQGYKIELSADIFTLDYEKWFSEEPSQNTNESNADYNIRLNEWQASMPKANLQYWNSLMGIQPLPANQADRVSTDWYYVIDMDWSSYANSAAREASTIYEEQYVSSWKIAETVIQPKKIEAAKEKERIVEATESNLYNLSQDIAKAFGVFCRYEFDYDDNYHITAKKIIYYNNFMKENEDKISFSYPYDSSHIQRTIDSADLVTKLYIASPEEDINIVDAEANKMREDYILNLDYLHTIGSISDEQYAMVAEYEDTIAKYNNELLPIINDLNYYYDERISTNANYALLKNRVAQDIEQLENARQRKNNLDSVEGVSNGIIYINQNNPKTGVLIKDSSTGYYYMNISEQGVIFGSIVLCTAYDFQHKTFDYNNGTEVKPGTPVYDEYQNLIKIDKISLNNDSTSKIVYMTYAYSPDSYYTHLIQTWENRFIKDKNDEVAAQLRLKEIDETIANLIDSRDAILHKKEDYIKKFNSFMGPAIREGIWTPDSYNRCESRYTESNNLRSTTNVTIPHSTPYATLMWDGVLFDSETDIKYKTGILEEEVYYPCIKINNNFINKYYNRLNEVSIIYYDYAATSQNPHILSKARFLTAQSNCEYGFIRNNSYTVVPILILTGAAALSEDEITYLKSNGTLGILAFNTTTQQLEIESDTSLSITWCTQRELQNSTVIHPRFEINNYQLKHNSTDLLLSYNHHQLTDYEDYYVLSKDSKYYITIKPEAILAQKTYTGNCSLIYAIDNNNISIYLDSVEVAKENATPKVSYQIDLSSLNLNFIHRAYEMLNRIVAINDVDLQFENVQGYIYSLSLDLDHPNNDTVEVKNYKNKFEDLFSSIVASVQSMQSNEYKSEAVYGAFNVDGTIKTNIIQNALDIGQLDYHFNNDHLILSEEKGIETTNNHDGIISIHDGGIFLANSRDTNGNRVWKSAILPEGVCADAITRGKLNISDIVIQSGDNIKLQLNKLGLFAYKSFIEDEELLNLVYSGNNNEYKSLITNNEYGNIDALQYVVHNSEGLFLVAKKNDLVVDSGAVRQLTKDIKRVEVSWDGFIIRNWDDEKVFYADTNGDLNLKGIINCGGGNIASWHIRTDKLDSGSGNGYVALQSFSDNSNPSEYVFWAGAELASEAPFAIKRNGQVINKDGTFEGDFDGTISTNDDSTLRGTLVTSNGFIGGDPDGLLIFPGGIGDETVGLVAANAATDVVFWAGYDGRTTQFESMALARNARIKNAPFRIYGNGKSYISKAELSDVKITSGNLTMGNLSIGTEGKLTVSDVSITGGSIQIQPNGTEFSFKLESSGKLTTKGSILSGSLTATALYLGTSSTNILNNNQIISSALQDGAALSSLVKILDTDNTETLSLSCIENGSTLSSLATNITMLNNKISLASISTSNNTTNIYQGINWSISPTIVSFNANGSLAITTSGFTLNRNGTASINGTVTATTGSKIGIFQVQSFQVYATDNTTNSATIGLTNIEYTNINTGRTYFNVTDSTTTVETLTLNQQTNNTTGLIKYTYKKGSTNVNTSLSAAELTALKSMIGVSSTTDWGASPDTYINNLISAMLIEYGLISE